MPYTARVNRARSLTTTLVGALLAAAAAIPVTATPVAAAGGDQLVAAANVERSEAGLAPVGANGVLHAIASERAQQQAAAQWLAHDFEYVKARFAQEGICWSGFGEILAWNGSGSADQFVQQWMNSTPHRTIMLGGYTLAGGGVAQGGDGHWYAAMIFLKPCSGTQPPSGGGSGFTDTAGSAFSADIAWLVGAGITSGCTSTRFCPTAVVSREQMASFLSRAMGLPSATRDFFADDLWSVHQPDINRVAQSAVASGCAAYLYCPTTTVSRGQMAAFLARALGLPATSRDYFWDDEASTFEDPINRLAASGITGGCAAGRFCVDGPVTREQMAGFLHRAFGD